jgi:2-furoyl-CoA dehydrogenase large subunit
MSTPVCIANAVADALGVADLELPLTPPHVLQLVKAADRPPAAREYRAQG